MLVSHVVSWRLNVVRYFSDNIYSLFSFTKLVGCMLKRAFLAVLLLVLTHSVASSAGSLVIVTGQNLGFQEGSERFFLGQPAKSVIERFGPAEKVTEDNYSGWNSANISREIYDTYYIAYTRNYEYVNDGLSLLEDRNGRLLGISFRIATGDSTPVSNAATDSGIRRGASLREIYRIHGQPYKSITYKLEDKDYLEIYYTRGKDVLSFKFNNGVLSTIGLNAGYLSYLNRQ